MENPFVAARDELLVTLARRDAEQRLIEDRERRAKLDEEDRLSRKQDYDLRSAQFESNKTERERLAKIEAADRDEKSARDRLRRDTVFAFRNAKEGTQEYETLKHTLTDEFDYRFPEKKPRVPVLRKYLGPDGKEHEDWEFPPIEGEDPPPRQVYHAPRVGPQEPKVTPQQIAALWPRALEIAKQAEDNQGNLPGGASREEYAERVRKQMLSDMRLDPAQYPLQRTPQARENVRPVVTDENREEIERQDAEAEQAALGRTLSPEEREAGRRIGPEYGQDINLGPEPGAPRGQPKVGVYEAELRAEAIEALKRGRRDPTPENIAIVVERLKKRLQRQ